MEPRMNVHTWDSVTASAGFMRTYSRQKDLENLVQGADWDSY